eukprot:COSAG02_NODE_1396_length_12898_cov_23.802953_16_plen_118_part_00
MQKVCRNGRGESHTSRAYSGAKRQSFAVGGRDVATHLCVCVCVCGGTTPRNALKSAPRLAQSLLLPPGYALAALAAAVTPLTPRNSTPRDLCPEGRRRCGTQIVCESVCWRGCIPGQ